MDKSHSPKVQAVLYYFRLRKPLSTGVVYFPFGEVKAILGWIFPSMELWGGLLILWKSNLFEVVTSEYGLYSTMVKSRKKQNGNLLWFTCIYGPSTNLDKSNFWKELNDIGNLIDELWCIAGDFNEILYFWDKKGLLWSLPPSPPNKTFMIGFLISHCLISHYLTFSSYG